jgi:hypothetical protein
VITPDGDVEAYTKLHHLLKRKNSFFEKERTCKKQDMDNLKDFIKVSLDDNDK